MNILETAASAQSFGKWGSGKLLPAMLSGMRVVRPQLRSDRAQEYVALSVRLGRELAALCLSAPATDPWCGRHLSALLSPLRMDQIADFVSRKDPIAAQLAQPQNRSTFSVQSQLVQIFLTVQEGSRRITGLDLSKFNLAEDGKAQPIDHMDSEQVPLQVALLLDTSQSMTESLKAIQEAAALFVQSLKPGDRVTLIPFNSNLRVVPQLTDDFEPILSAIRSTRAENQTKLYDAILYALKILGDKEGRKAIAVFSDGADTASTATLAVVVNAASRYGYPIYAVCAGAQTRSQTYRLILRQLTETNSGKAYFAENPRELGPAFLEVSAELRAAYVLYYYTRLTPDDRWHELIVNVADPGYRVYSRRGFFLARAGSAAALPKNLEEVPCPRGYGSCSRKGKRQSSVERSNNTARRTPSRGPSRGRLRGHRLHLEIQDADI